MTIDFVADPALMAFYLREVSPMPAAPMLYDGAGEPAVPIERKNTLIFWPGLLPQ